MFKLSFSLFSFAVDLVVRALHVAHSVQAEQLSCFSADVPVSERNRIITFPVAFAIDGKIC